MPRLLYLGVPLLLTVMTMYCSYDDTDHGAVATTTAVMLFLLVHQCATGDATIAMLTGCSVHIDGLTGSLVQHHHHQQHSIRGGEDSGPVGVGLAPNTYIQ